MSWYIGTLEQCSAYGDKVNGVKQYKGDVTSNWATPRRHPEDDYYAIIAYPSIDADEESGLQVVGELGEDWFPTEEE